MLWQLTHLSLSLSLSLLAGLARVVGTDRLPWGRCDFYVRLWLRALPG